MLSTLSARAAHKLPYELASLIDNTVYGCKPPERAATFTDGRPPLLRYIEHLIHSELSKDTLEKVARQLRKLPWRAAAAKDGGGGGGGGGGGKRGGGKGGRRGAAATAMAAAATAEEVPSSGDGSGDKAVVEEGGGDAAATAVCRAARRRRRRRAAAACDVEVWVIGALLEAAASRSTPSSRGVPRRQADEAPRGADVALRRRSRRAVPPLDRP